MNPRYEYFKQYTQDPKNRPKLSARAAVYIAVRKGKIIKPEYCQKCGRTDKRIEGHHKNYEEKLAIQWLCPKCHGAVEGRWKEGRPPRKLRAFALIQAGGREVKIYQVRNRDRPFLKLSYQWAGKWYQKLLRNAGPQDVDRAQSIAKEIVEGMVVGKLLFTNIQNIQQPDAIRA